MKNFFILKNQIGVIASIFILSQALLAKPVKWSIQDQLETIEIKSTDTCFSPAEQCDLKLIRFLNLSQTTIDTAIFALTHVQISEAFQKAKARGVSIRLIVDKDQAQSESSKVNELKNAGIEVRFGNTKSMMHNKFTISDKKQMETGSYNYTMNATRNNLENQIYLSDQEVIQKYQSEFDKMWDQGLKE